MSRLRGWSKAGASLAVAAVLIASGASPASADTGTGQWYIDAFHIPDIQASGITGDGVTIAVIDGPINAEVPALANSRLEVQEPSMCLDSSGAFLPAASTALSGPADARHGTGVASMIAGTGAGYAGGTGVAGVAPGARVLYYTANFLDDQGAVVCTGEDGSPDGVEAATARAMGLAIDAGADIVSISLSLAQNDDLIEAIARAHREGVVVVASVPNEVLTLSGTWPASGNGVVAVQSIDASGAPQGDPAAPNSFTFVTASGPGIGVLSQGTSDSGAWDAQELVNGTSYATPVVAGFLALVRQKYPEVTANQLIQTLIRNTGPTDHELVRDDFIGYGIASATHMLSVDPTQYPDENPLLTPDGLPSQAQIDQTPTSDPTAPAEPGSEFPWGVVILGAIGLIVVVGLIIVIIIIATRRSRRGAQR